MTKPDIEEISKKIQRVIDNAKSETERIDEELKVLWDEQDRISDDPAQFARTGDEKSYKDARLHGEFIADRIGILEGRKDALETQPLVNSAEYSKIMTAIQGAYTEQEKKCAEAFLKAADEINQAITELENVRTACNTQIFKTNTSLYWTEIAKFGSGEKVRDVPAYRDISPSKMAAAWVDLERGGSIEEAKTMVKQPESAQTETK